MFSELLENEMMTIDGGAYPIHEHNVSAEVAEREGRTIMLGMGTIASASFIGAPAVVAVKTGIAAVVMKAFNDIK